MNAQVRRPVVSPLGISMLIHYHCYPTRYPNDTSPAQRHLIDRFLRVEVIEADTATAETGRYRTTARGRAWLDLICATPLPEPVWVDPRTACGMASL